MVPSSYWVVPEQELRSWQVPAQRRQEVQLPAWESSLIPDTKHLEDADCWRRDSRACRAMKGKSCRAWKHQKLDGAGLFLPGHWLQWGVSSDIDTGLVASLDISLKVNCPYWDVVKNGVPSIALVTC